MLRTSKSCLFVCFRRRTISVGSPRTPVPYSSNLHPAGYLWTILRSRQLQEETRLLFSLLSGEGQTLENRLPLMPAIKEFKIYDATSATMPQILHI